MADEEDRPEAASDEGFDVGEFVLYGLALDHILRANPGMIPEAGRAQLLEACRHKQLRVRSGLSSSRQADCLKLNQNERALQVSRWHPADLEREFPTKPQSAAPEKASTPKQSPSARGGAPTKHGWEEVAVCFGAWFYERTGPQPAPKEMNDEVEKIFLRLGIDVPDRRQFTSHIRRWLEAYRKFEAPDEE
jgi:hypothetical protein